MAIAGLGHKTQRAPELFASGSRIHGHQTTKQTRVGKQFLGYCAPDAGSAK
jgi:hypothetical protein